MFIVSNSVCALVVVFITQSVRATITEENIHFIKCPLICICATISSEVVVNCAYNAIENIPKDYTRDVTHLDLSHNKIKVWHHLVFASASNLTQLDMSFNEMIEIEYKSFRGLYNLRTLNLSHNPIRELHTESFMDLNNLTTLDLSHTKLFIFRSNPFAFLTNLRHLFLDNTNIESMRPKLFAPLKSVESISIRNSLLTTITRPIHSGLENLRTIDMTGNPIHCDCHFKKLAENLTNAGIDLITNCMFPRQYHGIDWHQIGLNKMHCAPNIMGCRRKNVLVKSGTQVQLGCRVRLYDEETTILWFAYGDHTNYNVTWEPHISDESSIFTYLNILDAKHENRGRYMLHAENPAGAVKAKVSVIVSDKIEEKESLSDKQFSFD